MDGRITKLESLDMIRMYPPDVKFFVTKNPLQLLTTKSMMPSYQPKIPRPPCALGQHTLAQAAGAFLFSIDPPPKNSLKLMVQLFRKPFRQGKMGGPIILNTKNDRLNENRFNFFTTSELFDFVILCRYKTFGFSSLFGFKMIVPFKQFEAQQLKEVVLSSISN